MITIDYKSHLPIYDQIVNGIIRLCTLGALKTDDKLPSVRTLALSLGINPNTVQKAYGILEQNGIIYSVSGKGSFISGDAAATDSIILAAREEFKKAAAEAFRIGISENELCEILKEIQKGGKTE